MKKFFILVIIFCILYSSVLAEATPTDLLPLDLQEFESETALLPPIVTIWSDRKPIMRVGEIITLYSKVENVEGWIIKYQWEYGTDDIFIDIPGATGSTYSFPVTKENLALDYRLIIYYERDNGVAKRHPYFYI